MKNSLISSFEKKKFQDVSKAVPIFRPGDTVRVDYKIHEGGEKKKFRIQSFEGVVIRKKKGSAEATFTVRKIGANSIGVERCFPLYSPNIAEIKVLASGVVRRSRLYYLRQLAGKAARIRSKYGARVQPAATPKAEAPAATEG